VHSINSEILWLSDYESSSHQLVGWFIGFAFLFACFYSIPAQASPSSAWPTFDITTPFVEDLEAINQNREYPWGLT
jgi:hypothetical protein